MTSQLSSQLQRLRQRPLDADHRLSKSFLFSSEDAHTFSRDQIHQLALNGLQTLIAMDNRFHPFLSDLFDASTARRDRSMLTSAEDAALRVRLEYFMTLLGPHMFLVAAQQVFEYLVRVYEVHVHDVAAVLRLFLPYHDHNIFARAVLLLDLRDTGFDFLTTNQLRGAPMLREHLVTACAESRKAARLLCMAMALPFRYEVRHHASNALFASVAVQLSTHKDAEALWRTFLPFVLEFLSGAVSGQELSTAEGQRDAKSKGAQHAAGRVTQESVATALVVLASWSSQVSFSGPMLAALLKPVLRHLYATVTGEVGAGKTAPVLPAKDLLGFLELLAATQRRSMQDVAVSSEVDALLALPWRNLSQETMAFVPMMEGDGLAAPSFRHSALLAVLLRSSLDRLSLAERLEAVPEDVTEFLLCAAEQLPLSDILASALLKMVMTTESASVASQDTGAANFFRTIVEALERRYQRVFDVVLADVLMSEATHDAATAFLSRHLGGSRYKMLEVRGASAGVTETLPLFACLIHPIPAVRELAAKTMAEMPAEEVLRSSGHAGAASSSADGTGRQSLLDIMTNVLAYESSPAVAKTFIAAAAKLVLPLVKSCGGDKKSKKEAPATAVSTETEFVYTSLTKLVRALYAMAHAMLSAASQHSRGGNGTSTASAQRAIGDVVAVLCATFFQPLLSTTSAAAASALEKELRSTVLYHALVLYCTLRTCTAAVGSGEASGKKKPSSSVALDAAAMAEAVRAVEATIQSGVDKKSTEALFTATTGSILRKYRSKTTTGSKKSKTDDSDDDEEEALSKGEKEPVDFALVEAVSQSPALLDAIQSEAQQHLAPALQEVRKTVESRDNANSADAARQEVSAAVCVAAVLLSASASTEGQTQAAKTLKAFLCGAGDEGYLAATQKAAHARLEKSGKMQQTGRGATDVNALAAQQGRADGLVARLTIVLAFAWGPSLAQASIEQGLLLATMAGQVGGALPPLVRCPDVLAPIYMRLLEEQEADGTTSHVDWFALVADAVYGVTSETSSHKVSFAALGLLLLLPLRAPTLRREGLLRTLQDAILSGAGGSKKSKSSAQQLLATASSLKSVSITSLSSLVEYMAVGEAHSPLTPTAMELVGMCMAAETASKEGWAMPAGWATSAIYFFCPAPANNSGAAAKKTAPLQMALIKTMQARVLALLDSAERQGRTAAEADLVEAVCARLILWSDGSVAMEAHPALLLVQKLLQKPYLHPKESTTRPVYRHALTALATGLSEGLDDAASRNTKIFTTSQKKATKSSKGTSEGGLDAATQAAVAAHLSPFLVAALQTIGSDVASFMVGTTGGYTYFFTPLVAATVAAKKDAEKQAALMEAVVEVLSVLVPTARTEEEAQDSDKVDASRHWRAPASAVAASPITFADAMQLLELPKACREGPHWSLSRVSLQGLRLVDTLVRLLPLVVCRDDDDEAEGAESVYQLAQACLTLYPLSAAAPMMRAAAASAMEEDEVWLPHVQRLRLGSNRLTTTAATHVDAFLSLAEHLVSLCTEQTRLLEEGMANGAYQIKSLLLRQTMLLIADVLVEHQEGQDDEEQGAAAKSAGKKKRKNDEQTKEEEDVQSPQATALHIHVDTIAALLRQTAPLLRVRASDAALARSGAVPAPSTAEAEVTYLHIPLVSLLIRLEVVEKTEALGFRTAIEVCQDILAGFDVETQILCLSQLMRLVVDPAAQLANLSADAEEEEQEKSGKKSKKAAPAKEDGAAAAQARSLFRRMVKPNQIVNRQEEILHLINLTVKSEAFLEPFLELQRHTRHGAAVRHFGGKEAEKQEAEDEDAADAGEGSSGPQDNGCMELLVSALNLFAHYTDLLKDTRDSEAVPAGEGEEQNESVAYAALLEVLSGNTLACVLAGINEPTFVVCQERLLQDERAALHRIGLEVLLDRLHHSLPTLENVMSDEEMAEHRRRLRDPRTRLTLMDLVRVKARPLTTKRSLLLFPLLVQELDAAVARIGHYMDDAAPMRREADSVKTEGEAASMHYLVLIAQLSVACIEELLRIVSCGGSTQAEKALLNIHRSKRVMESTLVKLFGNKTRVTAVHSFVTSLCETWMPTLSTCASRLKASGGDEGYAFQAVAEEGILSTMTCCVTCLATVTQVMGIAFTSTHCIAVLHTVVSAAVFQVVELSAVVARGEAGALLRHSTLSSLIRCFPACWQMVQPYLPRIIFAATHLTNVMDAECYYLCSEVLTVLETVMEPQLFLEASTDCLRGIPYANAAIIPASKEHLLLADNAASAKTNDESATPSPRRRRVIKVQTISHSFTLLYNCVERRVQNMKKEELMHMSMLMEGTTAQQNFWIASLQALSSAVSMPTSETLQPVLDAITVFLLKFKAKHCVRVLRLLVDWAFGEGPAAMKTGTKSGKKGSAKHSYHSSSDGEEEGHLAGESPEVSRTTLQSWMVLFALVNHLLHKLGAIFDFGFPVVLPYMVSTLRLYCAATATAAKSVDALIALVLEGALESVRGMSAAQTPGPDYDYSIPLEAYFAVPEVFNSLMPALIHQVENVHFLTDGLHDYAFRAEHNVIPAIRAFMKSLKTEGKLQAKTQAELVRCLRHPSRHVRRVVLLCLDGLYADGGEEMAARLMAEMLPSVVEMTEDRDDAVVEAAKVLCNNLSHMTGQDVLHAMN